MYETAQKTYETFVGVTGEHEAKLMGLIAELERECTKSESDFQFVIGYVVGVYCIRNKVTPTEVVGILEDAINCSQQAYKECPIEEEVSE